jgi:hypothetical protein
MDNINILDYDKINLENLILYKPPKKFYNKWKIKCRYIQTNQKLYIRIPELYIDSDLEYDNYNNLYKFTCILSKDNIKIYNFFYNLEKYIIDYITSNSKQIFNITFNRHNVEKLFKSVLSKSKLLLNIKNKNGSINCKIFNEYNEEITLKEFEKDKKANFILCPNKIIFEKDKFFINWKICHIILDNNINNNELLDYDTESINDIDNYFSDSSAEIINIK